jgi:hypothetical protein
MGQVAGHFDRIASIYGSWQEPTVLHENWGAQSENNHQTFLKNEGSQTICFSPPAFLFKGITMP